MSPWERVAISDFRVANSPAALVVHGLGSCLGIALYDSHRRIGGLAHTLLPAPRTGLGVLRPGKFVNTAIQAMMEEMLRKGADRKNIGAKLVGGANMFELRPVLAEEGIGARNIRAAREVLYGLGIPVLATDVGGNHGRTMEFGLDNGMVLVRTIRCGDSPKKL
jgi:chemotaxis protein CheD